MPDDTNNQIPGTVEGNAVQAANIGIIAEEIGTVTVNQGPVTVNGDLRMGG